MCKLGWSWFSTVDLFVLDAKNNGTDRIPAWDIVPDEQRLYERLMRTYEPSVRPVINASKTVTITFKLTLNQIVDLVGTCFYYTGNELLKCYLIVIKVL